MTILGRLQGIQVIFRTKLFQEKPLAIMVLYEAM